jgi:hypothetical protein
LVQNAASLSPEGETMFARFSRSWQLAKASAAVLRQDKELVLFPLISLAALVLVLACFAAPVIGLGVLDGLHGGRISVLHYAIGFLFYFCQYFVIFFFNAALVGAAMIRLDGGTPTVAEGLRVARSKVAVIAGYALIAATVGMALRVIQERVGFIGRIIVGLLGVGWTIATYLVVPVLVACDVGPIEAVKESALLLKKTWGENVIGQAGLGAAFALVFLLVMLCGAALAAGAFMTHSVALIVAALALTVLALGIVALVQSALAGLYAAALYRYATTGEGTEGFDAATLKLAFAPK